VQAQAQTRGPVHLQGSILKQIDEEERLISGWISVEVVDREVLRQGLTTPIRTQQQARREDS